MNYETNRTFTDAIFRNSACDTNLGQLMESQGRFLFQDEYIDPIKSFHKFYAFSLKSEVIGHLPSIEIPVFNSLSELLAIGLGKVAN